MLPQRLCERIARNVSSGDDLPAAVEEALAKGIREFDVSLINEVYNLFPEGAQTDWSAVARKRVRNFALPGVPLSAQLRWLLSSTKQRRMSGSRPWMIRKPVREMSQGYPAALISGQY